MPYVLGIDVGPGVTAVALCRLDDHQGTGPAGGEPPAEPVALPGPQTQLAVPAARASMTTRASMATALYLPGDGSVLAGGEALARGRVDHRRVAVGFVERVGDDLPVQVGGEQYLANELVAALASWVVDQVAEQRGEAPDHVVVTHPAGWGGYRQGLLRQALVDFGIADVTVLPAPIAAGEAQLAHDPVPAGGVLAVLDLGAHACGVALLRRGRSGRFELLTGAGSALCADALDGVGLDPDADPELTAATLEITVDALRHALRSAGTADEAVVATVLVGASAGRLADPALAVRLPGRVVLAPHPELTVAMGAALTGRRLLSGVAPPVPLPAGAGQLAVPAGAEIGVADSMAGDMVDDPHGELAGLDGLDGMDDVEPEPPPRPAVEIEPLLLPPRRTVGRIVPGVPPRVLGAAAAVAAVVGVVLTVTLQGGGPANGPLPDQLNPGRGTPTVTTRPAEPNRFTDRNDTDRNDTSTPGAGDGPGGTPGQDSEDGR